MIFSFLFSVEFQFHSILFKNICLQRRTQPDAIHKSVIEVENSSLIWKSINAFGKGKEQSSTNSYIVSLISPYESLKVSIKLLCLILILILFFSSSWFLPYAKCAKS